MKRFTFFSGILFLLLSACSKPVNNSNDDLYQNAPASKVPDALAKGTWFSGTLSPISFFDRDGHHLGNEYEAGREFTFSNVNGKGRIKFWQYLGMKTYSTCVTENYTYKEGSVVFEDDTFTFYPVKGNFRTVKDKCSSGNGTVNRNADGDDLKPVTYRWEIINISGVPNLYTYDEDDLTHENPLFIYELLE